MRDNLSQNKNKNFNKNTNRKSTKEPFLREEEEDKLQLEGRNAVLEALNHDKPIDKILIRRREDGEIEGSLKIIFAKAKEKGIIVQETGKSNLDERALSRNHQGVIAICPAKEYVDVSDILDIAAARGEDPFIIILNGITDTYNFGAIIRSAEACGAHGIIIPKRRAATLTGMVSKASAGAISHVAVARVSNIADTIVRLQNKGVWVACADLDGDPCFKTQLKGSIAIVIGGEGGGVGKLVKEKCDFTMKIPMYGKITSLNASVAAGILMYEIVRQRKW